MFLRDSLLYDFRNLFAIHAFKELLCVSSVFDDFVCKLVYFVLTHSGQEFFNVLTLFQQLLRQLVSIRLFHVRHIFAYILTIRESLLDDFRNLFTVQRVEIFFGDSVAGDINVRLFRCLTAHRVSPSFLSHAAMEHPFHKLVNLFFFHVRQKYFNIFAFFKLIFRNFAYCLSVYVKQITADVFTAFKLRFYYFFNCTFVHVKQIVTDVFAVQEK